jgi:hypothetical protein
MLLIVEVIIVVVIVYLVGRSLLFRWPPHHSASAADMVMIDGV